VRSSSEPNCGPRGHDVGLSRGAPGREGSRRRRFVIIAVCGVLALVAGGLATGTLYMLSLPGVGDAPARVERLLALHKGTATGLPPPRKLSAAIVAVEDEHLYSSPPINVLDGAGRAALATLEGSPDPGGSTIPQQLAKLLYGRGSGLGATLREVGLGLKLSLRYSPSQILVMYLNAVYYGGGYWGDVAAARGYFHTTPNALSWPEAAMLAGLPQAPSAYDPLQHYRVAKQRQRHVLDRLVANHDLTRAQANSAFFSSLPLRELAPKRR
jgi:hypothetical protein